MLLRGRETKVKIKTPTQEAEDQVSMVTMEACHRWCLHLVLVSPIWEVLKECLVSLHLMGCHSTVRTLMDKWASTEISHKWINTDRCKWAKMEWIKDISSHLKAVIQVKECPTMEAILLTTNLLIPWCQVLACHHSTWVMASNTKVDTLRTCITSSRTHTQDRMAVVKARNRLKAMEVWTTTKDLIHPCITTLLDTPMSILPISKTELLLNFQLTLRHKSRTRQSLPKFPQMLESMVTIMIHLVTKSLSLIRFLPNNPWHKEFLSRQPRSLSSLQPQRTLQWHLQSHLPN